MITAPKSNAEGISHDLTHIGDVISAARDLVADGQLVNLGPLEREVDRICGGLGELTRGEAERVKPVLLSLMDELDRLAEEMRARQGEYESELRSLASHQNAAKAYRQAPASRKSK